MCWAFRWLPGVSLDSKGRSEASVSTAGFEREKQMKCFSCWIQRVTRCKDASDSKETSVWDSRFVFLQMFKCLRTYGV